MLVQARRGFVGLVTATAETSAGEGALRIADNVTLRRQGALTSREGFSSTVTLSRSYLAAYPYQGQTVYIDTNGQLYNPAQTLRTLWNGSSIQPVRVDAQRLEEARKNLYLIGKTGAYKLTSPTGTRLEYAGLPPIVTGSSYNLVDAGGAGNFLPNNSHVAYRLVAKATDPNGLVVRSRPTGWIRAVNASGLARAVRVQLINLSPFMPGFTHSEVEVYRTRTFPMTASVDDELQLVHTAKISAFDANYYNFTDSVADAARGTTLYTSPSRGGIENASDRPPGAAVVKMFRGSLFYGNIVGPARFVVSLKTPDYSTGNLAGQATGIGQRVVTGTVTAGSAVITAVSSTAGIEAGQIVGSPGGSRTVVSTTANTITVDSAHTASATGTSIFVNDVLEWRIGSGTVYRWAVPQNNLHSPYSTDSRVIAYQVSPANPGFTHTYVIETLDRSASALELRASHGGEYSPPLPTLSESYLAGGAAEALPHGIAWSEPDEPEHVPAKNYARVGDAGKAILALEATRDSLWIFKEDGLFRLSGTTAANFRIDPFDPSCICVLPSSVRRLQNAVVALTTRGLVIVTEGGVQVVSDPIQTELSPIIQAIRTNQKTSGLYLMPGLSGSAATVDEAQGEYLLGLGSTTPSFGGQTLVLNVLRQGFTTYTFPSATPVAYALGTTGQPVVLTSTQQLEPSGQTATMTVRISPHAFGDPLLTGKLWTHIVAGITRLTGASSVQARYASTMPTADALSLIETLELPTSGGVVQLPNGSLLRHPAPRAHARGWLLRIEYVFVLASGFLILELIGSESRENLPNRIPTHGTGGS